MAFSISSVSPGQILADGGHAIVVTGSFEAGHQYRGHMCDLGTTDDPACYSGKPGDGNIVSPTPSEVGGSLDTLTVYSPRVTPDSSAYDIVVIDVDTYEVHLLSGVIEAVKKQFFSTVYSMKRLYAPKFYVGPRTIDLEEPT